MIQVPFTKPGQYIRCPACGQGEYRVDHLGTGRPTRWYCNASECGYEFSVQVLSPVAIECLLTGGRKRETEVTVRVDAPFTMTVQGIRLEPVDDLMDWEDSQRFFYEENACPVNVFRRVNEVYDQSGDDDPHGLIKFVKVEIIDANRNEDR